MPVVGDAYVVVRAITTNFEREVQNALRRANLQNAGQQASQSFSRGFRSGVTQDANGLAAAFANIRANGRDAAEAFRKLVTAGYFLGPGIAALVGAVGSLASGLVILVSQVAAAIPALAALGGALAALGQAFAVVKMGLSGIGEALKARSKEAKGAGKDNEAALRRIEDAERSLARVIESNRERLVNAARELADAEQNLADARDEASENLQQLRFDAEDAAISEQKATLELEKARERLLRVQDLPPNSRARREAEIAFAEADLNLRRARDSYSDLSQARDEANQKGVEGSKEVTEAIRRLRDAEDSQARAERDALRAQIDAERALARAREDAAKAGGGAAGDDAFEKLIPEAQAFVDLLISIKERFKAVKEEVQRQFLPSLGEALSLLVDSYFPALERILPATAKALGETSKKFAEIVTSQNALKSFEKIGGNNVYIIEQLGTAAGNLLSSILALLDAAGPLTRRFADWVVTLTNGWKNTLEVKNKTGELTDMFNYAGDVAAQLGDIFGNIIEALMNIGRAASGPGSAGEMLLTSFENATQKFADFTARISADGSLDAYFKRVVPNVEAIGRLVNELALAFIKLGDDEGVGKFADSLGGAFTTISEALERLLEGAPALGEFIDKFVEFLALFAESDSIQNFFSVLNFGLDIMIKVFSNDMIMKIVLTASGLLGFVKAITLIKNLGVTSLTILTGYVQKFGDLLRIVPGLGGPMNTLAGAFRNAGVAFQMRGGGLTGLSAAFTTISTMAGPILIVVGVIAALVAIFILAYQNSEKLREAVGELVTMVKDALSDAFRIVEEAITGAFPSISGFGELFEKIGDYIADNIIPLFKIIIPAAIRGVATTIGGVIKIIGGIFDAFKGTFQLVGAIFKLFRGDFDGFFEGIKNATKSFVSAFGKIFSGIFDMFRGAINPLIQLWNSSVGGFGFTLPSWIPVIGGKRFEIPKINFGVANLPTEFTGGSSIRKMALGGTVFPTRNGTIVRVAEAGKPERIEPLDNEGLSKRDRAIITQLSGGRGGQTINVYPSPGMDERELAAMISRQLAFQLRAGAI